MAIRPLWVLIRTFVAQAAEGHAADPPAGGFVVPPEHHGVDLYVSFEDCVFAGAPNSGTFWIWALHADGALTVLEKLAEVIVAGAESGFMMPVIVRNGPALIYVTIDSFNGGQAPTVTGVVKMRRVSQGNLGSDK
jgi:hypothetical protein